MSDNKDAKELLREEFTNRVREAVKDRNWVQLEHWAKQWIQMEPQAVDGFKWLARAATALNKIPRAAYAYSRLLDFEPHNEEARNFFARNPSILDEQTTKLNQKLDEAETQPQAATPEQLLSPDQRQKLSSAELELGQLYDSYRLFAQAAVHFQQSFAWYPNQIAALAAARTLHKSHRGSEAMRFLREQLYYFPNWIEGRLLLGRILFELGNRADAQKEWQSVLQQDAENREAMNFLRGLYTHSL